MSTSVVGMFALPILLWVAYGIAYQWDWNRWPAFVAQFQQARTDRSKEVFDIAGEQWAIHNGSFWRVRRYDKAHNVISLRPNSDRLSRISEERVNKVIRLVGGLGSPLVVLAVPGIWAKTVFACVAVAAVALEALYQNGFQGVPGAIVLDPSLALDAESEVAGQKVHGEARVASEAEARRAASPRDRKSSIHDQEF